MAKKSYSHIKLQIPQDKLTLRLQWYCASSTWRDIMAFLQGI